MNKVFHSARPVSLTVSVVSGSHVRVSISLHPEGPEGTRTHGLSIPSPRLEHFAVFFSLGLGLSMISARVTDSSFHLKFKPPQKRHFYFLRFLFTYDDQIM